MSNQYSVNIKICVCCAYHVVNNELCDYWDVEHPGYLMDACVEYDGVVYSVVCDLDAEPEFSYTPCYGCRTELAGDRYLAELIIEEWNVELP